MLGLCRSVLSIISENASTYAVSGDCGEMHCHSKAVTQLITEKTVGFSLWYLRGSTKFESCNTLAAHLSEKHCMTRSICAASPGKRNSAR